MTAATRVIAVGSFVALLATYAPDAGARQPPIQAYQAAGENLEAEAQRLHEQAADVLGPERRNEALLRDLPALRVEIQRYRTAVDTGADPRTVGGIFRRVSELQRDVRKDLSRLRPDLSRALSRRARRLDRAYDELARLMGE